MTQILTVLFVVIMASTLNSAGSINTEELFQKTSESIVLIESVSKDDKKSIGTGFVINGGYIVTNHHVIKNAKRVVVKTQTDERYPMTALIADDYYRDISILYPAVPSLTALQLGNSKNIHTGAVVAVIGNPEGFENSISEGLISGIRNIDNYNQIFQLSAPISHGSSGSPVFDSNNEVIGMVSSFLKNGQLINFAVPSNQIHELLRRSRYSSKPTVSNIDQKMGYELYEGAKKNDPKSQYKIGLIYAKDREYNIAFQWFQLAAKKNYYPAEEMLGYFYMKGVGVNADKEKSTFWFRESIKHGNTKSRNTEAE